MIAKRVPQFTNRQVTALSHFVRFFSEFLPRMATSIVVN
jgi:hypothetical protein